MVRPLRCGVACRYTAKLSLFQNYCEAVYYVARCSLLRLTIFVVSRLLRAVRRVSGFPHDVLKEARLLVFFLFLTVVLG